MSIGIYKGKKGTNHSKNIDVGFSDKGKKRRKFYRSDSVLKHRYQYRFF